MLSHFQNICVLSSNHPDCKTDKSPWPLNPKFARSLCVLQHAAADLAGSAGNRAAAKMDELEHQAQLLVNCRATQNKTPLLQLSNNYLKGAFQINLGFPFSF